ncbi:protein-disulfide reductase DsbD [Acinetobacter puyangensis]|nr:protein-disulfide reductase DsbD [Acinetobacter puyangensis]
MHTVYTLLKGLNSGCCNRLKWWSALQTAIFILLMMVCLPMAYAEQQFLPNEQAFQFDAQSLSKSQVELKWKVAPDYYLYQHQFAVQQGQKALVLDLPPAKAKHDAFFGDTKVYYQTVAFNIQVQPNQHYHVTYQGCAEKGLCYPMSKADFQTDQDGLVILADSAAQQVKPHGLLQSSQPSVFTQTTDVNRQGQASQTATVDSTEDNSNQKVAMNVQSQAQDEIWSNRLHQQSLFWSILLFLGLGILLAFTPCSLPMLPILSSLLIRKHNGVKAGLISLIFVLSMASVYAMLGIMAASAGNNFQRWLQQPTVLIAFSSIFILFALNLFGVFELKLPQSWSNKLDQLQSRQKGGTLVGAALMGMLSALLVGPCMTAPLAGTLLYISQSQNIFAGAVLLFSLGLGMGVPLILLSLIGERAIPKPGIWMMYVRHVFAFIMLGLSLYFVRPLLSIGVFNLCLLLVAIALALYLIYLVLRAHHWIRYTASLCLVILLGLSIWKGTQYWQYQTQQQQIWQVVTTQAEFNQALQQAKLEQKPIIIDLYADWCIACQPIERNVWHNPDVQQKLQSMTKIKLDLSRYDQSQQALLNEWQILGPPTVLFLDAQAQELRHLRLTGEFNTEKLLSRINN